jgi:hypothetical protein
VKPIRMLGLAVAAALAATALLGAGSASAKPLVQLCKVKGETPCSVANTWASPLTIKAELEAGAQAELSDHGSIVISCQKSEIKGTATGNDLNNPQQVIGEFTKATWEECTGPFGEVCTVKPLQLSWRGHVSQKEEQDNGWLYAGELNGKGQPGAEIVCSNIIFGNTECFVKVKEKQPKNSAETEFEPGEWAKLEVVGGNPAKVHANVQLKVLNMGANHSRCEDVEHQANWKAQYVVPEPSPLYITHDPNK